MKKEVEVLQRCIGSPVEVTATGIGVKRSVPFLLRIFREARPSLLIFTGSASQLDLTLHMSDIVMPREWCFENGRCTPCDAGILKRLQAGGWPTVARGISLDRAVLKAAQRKSLFESTGGAVYDSVTAAVLRTAQTEGVPFLAPKTVNHTVGSGLTSFWNRLDRNIAPLGEYLRKLLELVPDLIATPVPIPGRSPIGSASSYGRLCLLVPPQTDGQEFSDPPGLSSPSPCVCSMPS